MQLASITESASQGRLLLIRQFFARLTRPFPSECTLTFAHSFAELSRKYPYQTPAISTGRIRGKANTRGLGVCLAPARSHFWKLGRCMWSLFLETSESNVRQYQRQTMVRMLDLSHLFWHEVTPLQGTARKIKSPHDIQKSSHHRQITMAQHAQKFNQILWYRSRISSCLCIMSNIFKYTFSKSAFTNQPAIGTTG